jgi:hypothetical protein
MELFFSPPPTLVAAVGWNWVQNTGGMTMVKEKLQRLDTNLAQGILYNRNPTRTTLAIVT